MDGTQSKTVKQIPWYKERVKTHYIKTRDNTQPSKFYQPKNWTFIKDGLDDFRDGFPTSIGDDVILRPKEKGVGPNVRGQPNRVVKTKSSQRSRFSKNQILFSKELPQQEKKREYVAAIEDGLLKHPLALYPYLEEGIPPELFEDIVDILDPELGADNEAEFDHEEGDDDVMEEATAQDEAGVAEETRRPAAEMNIDPILGAQAQAISQLVDEHKANPGGATAQRNPYRNLPKLEPEKMDPRELEVMKNEEYIKTVTAEFCQWIRDMGGSDDNNIEEATIHSLFASGYETKPALSVPIHVVEMQSIPPELRSVVSAHKTRGGAKAAAAAAKTVPDNTEPSTSSAANPDFRKFRYGAWYLPRQHWHKMDAEEPLRDPDEARDDAVSEQKQRSYAMDDELLKMHGSKAFLNFIQSRGDKQRMPEFVKRFAELQLEMQRAAEAANDTSQTPVPPQTAVTQLTNESS